MSPLTVISGACGHDCPDTCSWLAEVRDGQVVGLSGDPRHPFTRGTLCAKVNHYLERVYHPDRVLHPMKRVGAKGAGRFERTTWREALAEIAARWQKMIAESGAESVLPFSFAGNQGLIQMSSLDRRLFALLGVSRLERHLCGEVAAQGLAATQGNGWGIDPEEIVHSRLIVLWGTNTIVTNLHLWPILLEARSRGARLIVIDPIRTRTAEQADWHLPVRPASDAALALGLMHVIIRENLIDRDYVTRFAEGFEPLAEHVREYSPDRVAAITGLAPEDIERLAIEYATTRPSLIRPLIGMEHHRNGAGLYRAVACLPVLTGAWRHRGGGLFRSAGSLQNSTLNHQGVAMPELEQPGVRQLNMRDLGEILTSRELAPPVRGLCVYNSNPAVSIPDQARVLAGLSREDLFTVVHDLFVTETAAYADFILPATSQLESLDLVPAWGHHYLALNRPAIPPCGEAVSNTEFFRRLAAALGRTEPFLFESDESLLRTALDSSHPWLAGITFERLWNEGFTKLNHEQDWRPFAEGRFPTPSGKAQLWSESLRQRGLDPLPTVGEIRQPDREPLRLITGKTLHFLNSSYAHSELHRRREGTLFVELSRQDAASRGLGDGERARVFNGRGSLVAECRVSERVRPGVAWMPFGGHEDALGRRCSVNLLTPPEPTDWGGGSGFYDAFVEVERHRAEAAPAPE